MSMTAERALWTVRRLREKLDECQDGASRLIATRHGVGYYYDPTAGKQ